jgi:hypothetical protein
MLAFAHLSERRPDADSDEPDPIAEVGRQAQQVLGDKIMQYQDVRQDSRQAVPHEAEITFVPDIPGIEFNPRRRSFLWLESVHREEFHLRASPSLDGQTVRGSLSVYLGAILIGDIALTIRVESSVHAADEPTLEFVGATLYRKIFASYSHKDVEIVEQFDRLITAFGDEYLRDLTHLRAGEVWSRRLEEMITDANVFQLFWSSNSMKSQFVRNEWEYALSLRRRNFVRPTYWEEPLPEDRASGLPPESLRRLHFKYIGAASRQESHAFPPGDAGSLESLPPLRDQGRRTRNSAAPQFGTTPNIEMREEPPRTGSIGSATVEQPSKPVPGPGDRGRLGKILLLIVVLIVVLIALYLARSLFAASG